MADAVRRIADGRQRVADAAVRIADVRQQLPAVIADPSTVPDAAVFGDLAAFTAWEAVNACHARF